MGSNGNGGSNGDEIRIDVDRTRESNTSESGKQFVGEQSDGGGVLNDAGDEKTNVSQNAGSGETSDMGSTPKADFQMAMSLQQSPASGILQLKDPSFSSPHTRRGYTFISLSQSILF